MLLKLSYFNLIFALVYVLVYLKDGTINSTVGILMVMVFNWLGIRSYQLDNYKWKFWHYLIGIWSLYYACYVLYGVVNILTAAFEYNYVSDDTITFLLLSGIFCIALISHLIVYSVKALKTNNII